MQRKAESEDSGNRDGEDLHQASSDVGHTFVLGAVADLSFSFSLQASPSAEDVKAVLASVDITADEERLATLISELEGKDINT